MKKIYVSILILGIVALAGYGTYWVTAPSPIKTATGRIRYVDKDGGFWGLEAERKFLAIPLGTKKLGFKGLPFKTLPADFQVEGLKVKCTYQIGDVIGLSDWDTFIKIIDIEKVPE
jgi:hypothetical protein